MGRRIVAAWRNHWLKTDGDAHFLNGGVQFVCTVITDVGYSLPQAATKSSGSQVPL
jgi:hypothetical protein